MVVVGMLGCVLDGLQALRKLICGKVSQKQCQTAKLATEMLQLILNIKAVRVFWNHDKFILNISYS